MSELKKIPEDELAPKEKEISRGIASGFGIMEKGSEHCICDEEGEEATCYDPEDFEIGNIIDSLSGYRAEN